MSHSGNTETIKDKATKMSIEYVSIKEEMEWKDVKITRDKSDETSIEDFKVKEEYGIDFAAVDESITVVKHEVDDYSLESIEVVQPENTIMDFNQEPEKGKKFRSFDDLKTDIGACSYPCEHCDKGFNNRSSLDRHLLRHKTHVHISGQLYRCETCQKNFSCLSHLKRHQLIHSGIKNFECKHCCKRFRYKGLLNKHLCIISGEKQYRCNICDHRFINKSTLNRHLFTHPCNKSYSCKICNHPFSQKNTLKLHMAKHTGEKTYQCETCQKTFKWRNSLVVHQKQHYGSKEFECQHCKNVRYTLKKHLRRHITEMHTPDDIFACHICEATFKTKLQCKEHMIQMHKDRLRCTPLNSSFIVDTCTLD